MDRWVGKTAVVTGASAGIGAAIAVSLAEAGLNVVGLARSPDLVEIKELNNQLKAGKGKIQEKKCDISSRDEIIKVFAEINEQFGRINIVVNNAGRVSLGTFTDASDTVVSDEDIEMVIKTNTLGLVTCSREAAKYMKQTGEQGHIVNISSIGGLYVPSSSGMPRQNIYCGSKHAVQATTETMRLEFSHSKANIKTTSMCPGAVRTNLAKEALEGTLPADVYEFFPMLEASDVAGAVLSVIATPPRVNISQVIIRPVGETL